MRRLIYISILTLLCVAAASAQERYERVVRHNMWNMGGGTAGLRLDSLSTSYAEIYAVKENGKFVPTYGSADSWNFGAQMKSVYHLKKISFAGGFGYDYFLGNRMCGSMFTRPGYYPVDILEFTPGRKIRETYSFEGGMSVELGRGLMFGLLADVSAQSYSKRKDLRHKNNALDLRVMPSLTWRFADGAVGATYIFDKNSESVSAGEYGVSSENYYAFFDKGICYGNSELWTGSGIHLDEAGVSGFPVREFTNGAMLQAQWRGVYVDASYRRGSGRTGEKQTIWHEFGSDAVDAHIGVALRGRWFIRAGFGYFDQTNNENVMNTVTENGVTIMRKFGSNAIFSRRSYSASLEAEYAADRWEIVFGANYRTLDRLSTLVYPQYRTHSMDAARFFADARMVFGAFEVSLSASGAFGGSDEGGGVVVEGINSGDYPVCLNDWLAAETEWFTASRVGCGVGLRYNIRKFYIDLRGDYTRAFGVRMLGSNRVNARLSAGYRF
jgi:hypothetical protein